MPSDEEIYCSGCGSSSQVCGYGREFIREQIDSQQNRVNVQAWQPKKCGDCGAEFALLIDEQTEG